MVPLNEAIILRQPSARIIVIAVKLRDFTRTSEPRPLGSGGNVRPVWSIASQCKSDQSPERRELVGNKARVPEETPHCTPEEGSKCKEGPMTDLKKA